MILGSLLLITGLVISAVAIYYSVIGLAAIFAAATIPIYIMGASLEVAKLVCASWLKANWSRAPILLKTYMTTAVVVLMIITSMGIFGFLSKAHTDQGIVSGEVIERVRVIDEKISTEKENIDVARKALKQLDESVDQVMARSNDERGAERATQIRRSQARERSALQRDINNAQNNIARLQAERAPIAKDLRKVEAEVGPIKYIAQLIYGNDPDQNLLEKAVTWVTIMIVAVFDPLAVVMLLGAQMSFQWWQEERKRRQEEAESDAYLQEAADALNDAFKDDLAKTTKTPEELMDLKPDPWVADVGEKPTAEELEEIGPEPVSEPATHHPDTHPYLRKGFVYPEGWEHEPPVVYKPEEKKELEQNLPSSEVERPGDYLIMPELQEESKKKVYDQSEGEAGGQNQKVSYVQNEEQTRSSLWFKIRTKKDDPFKPLDRLHIEFDKDGFEGIIIKPAEEPELYQFVEDIKTGTHKYGDYPEEQINYFASRIYELRKNQSNNTP